MAQPVHHRLRRSWFGRSGLVGRRQRIREQQATYPILQISGPAGSGKATLVANLWKLAGSSSAESRSPGTCSFGALLAFLAYAPSGSFLP